MQSKYKTYVALSAVMFGIGFVACEGIRGAKVGPPEAPPPPSIFNTRHLNDNLQTSLTIIAKDFVLVKYTPDKERKTTTQYALLNSLDGTNFAMDSANTFLLDGFTFMYKNTNDALRYFMVYAYDPSTNKVETPQ